MKILYHHRTASKDGQAVHIEEMVAAMRAQGHEVRVVIPNGINEAHFGVSPAPTFAKAELEVLTDGENALMFDGDDPQGFETALTRLCADSALRERLAQGARATIARLDLTWEGNARRVAALASILQGSPLRA